MAGMIKKAPPYVVDIGDSFIKLKASSPKSWQDARDLGAGYRLFPPAFGIKFDNEQEMLQALSALRDSGFFFLRTGAWNDPASRMEELTSHTKISPGYTAIKFSDRENWALEKHERRPHTRPFFGGQKSG
jgi:hypothetical protein